MSRRKIAAIAFGILIALVAATSATAKGRSFIGSLVGTSVDEAPAVESSPSGDVDEGDQNDSQKDENDIDEGDQNDSHEDESNVDEGDQNDSQTDENDLDEGDRNDSHDNENDSHDNENDLDEGNQTSE
jgi:hypothetical protein